MPTLEQLTGTALLVKSREESGLTKTEVANACGIALASLVRMEHGTRVIGKRMAQRMGEFFKKDWRLFLTD